MKKHYWLALLLISSIHASDTETFEDALEEQPTKEESAQPVQPGPEVQDPYFIDALSEFLEDRF